MDATPLIKAKVRYRKRKRLGITRAELAERIGVNESTLFRWELGRTRPIRSLERRWDEVLSSTAKGD